MIAAERWLIIVLLCLSGSIIYWLPFFSDVFYVPMRNAFGFTNTQIGILVSTFGFTSLLGYFPGGWLADRFSPRKLICVALLITSAVGFVFSTIPSFVVCLFLYGTWGLAIALLFWSAMIKAIRSSAGRDKQGQAFGILEGGRSVTDLVSATALLALFAMLGGDYAALRENIMLEASAPLVLAVVVWFLIRDDAESLEVRSATRTAVSLASIKAVLRVPTVWLLATIIMAAYCGYWGSVYFTPYATEIFGLGEIYGGAIAVAKYWIAPVAAVTAGFIADKVGTAKAVVGAFILMTAGFFIFGLVPGAPILLPLLFVNVALISCAVFALRGIYFALLEQGGIPMAITGTATGVVSVIGYTPDVFVPPMAGMVLDAYPGADGFQVLFLIIGSLNFIGLMAALSFYRKVRSNALKGTFVD